MYVKFIGSGAGPVIPNSAFRGEVTFYYNEKLVGLAIGSTLLGLTSADNKLVVDFSDDGLFVLEGLYFGESELNGSPYQVVQGLSFRRNGTLHEIGKNDTSESYFSCNPSQEMQGLVTIEGVYAGTRITGFIIRLIGSL